MGAVLSLLLFIQSSGREYQCDYQKYCCPRALHNPTQYKQHYNNVLVHVFQVEKKPGPLRGVPPNSGDSSSRLEGEDEKTCFWHRPRTDGGRTGVNDRFKKSGGASFWGMLLEASSNFSLDRVFGKVQ